ncbi:MAG TPA: peptidylprolyl isomerase [Thermoanaerobaculia bacterium]|nr:peptidylprolyl isomerase [Thermoanaerobaculia bacterium]
MRTFRLQTPTALVASAVLAGCLTFGAEKGPPRGTYRERLHGFAALLRMEDRRAYDPLLSGRTASSPDPWLRAKTALAVSRLKDPDASIYLPVLLKDAEAPVRRAATFGAGLSGDARLLPFLVAALGDPDVETAANAAEALGKLGGKEAVDALLAVLAKPAGPRAASALALFRKPESRTVTALLGAFEEENLAPELRRAVVYALSRKPQPEAASALRAVLRKGHEDQRLANALSSEEVAWAARGLGILEDEESAPDLVRLAASRDVSVSVQALTALDSLSRKSALSQSEESTRGAFDVALVRAKDPLPGVAIAALRLLGALPDSPASRATLEENLLRRGWRGQTALVSLTRLDAAREPKKAATRIDDAVVAGTLELRLGAAEALRFFEDDGPPEGLATILLADRAARVRAAALSSLSKKPSSRRSAWLLAGLIDRDPAVRDVALDAAAPLLEKGSTELKRAWAAAFDHAFESGGPDFTVGALEAAASRGEAGHALVVSHEHDPDAVTREKARRLLVEKYGAAAASFRPIPVATRHSMDDYGRVARAANETLVEAEIVTTRGTFRMELLAEDAPLTVESFRALASRRFFDGVAIHRVVPDFVVQTGDPRGDGSGGPGYAIRDEINPSRYVRGAVGMALSGADTGGSQWFVALSSQLHLDGGYTVFGRVLDGDEVLDRIEQDDRLVSVRVTSRPREIRPPGAVP